MRVWGTCVVVDVSMKVISVADVENLGNAYITAYQVFIFALRPV